MSSWLSYCQNFHFFKARAGFSVLVDISVKYASLLKIKHYSVLQTLLQDLVAKTAFKKGGFSMFYCRQHYCAVLYTAEQLISHLWTISPLKGTIFSRTEGYWSLNKNTSPLQKIKKKKKKKNWNPTGPTFWGLWPSSNSNTPN